MEKSSIFAVAPETWGLRGDPYFWEYLRDLIDEKEIKAGDDIEALVKDEYFALSGKEMTGETGDFVRIERFAHGGMSSGGLSGQWWLNNGIPLLQGWLRSLKEKNIMIAYGG